MGKNSAISWTNATWNPIRGCTMVSPGCVNCYAMAVAARFSGLDPRTGKPLPYYGLAKMTESGPRWTNQVRLVPEHLRDPIKWKKPLRIFVNSMSDLFHEKLEFPLIDDIFDVMIQAPWHTYQILTKRAERMLEYFDSTGNRAEYLVKHPGIWMGVSVEDQDAAHRLDPLVQIPAGVRWVSAEPLIGPLDMGPWYGKGRGIGWVVVGGESGAGARPMKREWATSIREDCKKRKIPYFFKQKGIWLAKELGCKDRKGADYDEFPEDLKTQEYPAAVA